MVVAAPAEEEEEDEEKAVVVWWWLVGSTDSPQEALGCVIFYFLMKFTE